MKYIIGNQKNYLTMDDAIKFSKELEKIKDNNVIIAPSNIYLPYFSKCNSCAQNVSFQSNSPFTGEITSMQLKSMNINYCIVGHSERRINLGESNEHINKKVIELLNSNITPILCVGENRVEKDNFLTKDVINLEINAAVDKLSTESVEKIIIAYEPLWAISDGKNPSIIPTNSEINDIVNYIKTFIKEKTNADIKVLYGGSVNPNNVDELNKIDNVDGYLIGGASKKISDFITIIKKCN